MGRESLRCAVVAVSLSVVAPSAPVHGQDPAGAPLAVELRVVDRTTGSGIPAVSVLLPDLESRQQTDSLGFTTVRAPAPGAYTLLLVHPAYEEQRGELTIDRGGSFELALTPRPPVQDGTGGILGRLTALESGDALPDAVVRLPEYDRRDVADGEGTFSFSGVPTGSTSVTIELLGRATVRQEVFIRDGEVVTLDVGLPVDPVDLPGISVSVLPRWLVLQGFERRRRWMPLFTGRQWTREDVAMGEPLLLGDLVRRVPGIVGSGLNGYRQLNGCRLIPYVDGLPVGENFDVDSIDPDRLEALEVFRGGRGRPLPLGFRGGGCGLILVWLRR